MLCSSLRGLAAALLAVLTAAAPPTQAPSLVADLNSQPLADPSGQPGEAIRFGAWIYFSADARGEGRELHRTPTAGVAELFVDLRIGPAGSNPAEFTVLGVPAALQAVSGPTPTALGADLTNAVLLTLGR
ncbi:MAG: hypothetical protein AAF628_29505 [Planctomycetota bacterium]